MWTPRNRKRYDRSQLRYPTDVTDDEWALIAPLIPPAKPGGNKRTVDLREVMNGVMYVLGTGCQWRAIPKDLPPRSTVHDYFDLLASRPRRHRVRYTPESRRLVAPPKSSESGQKRPLAWGALNGLDPTCCGLASRTN